MNFADRLALLPSGIYLGAALLVVALIALALVLKYSKKFHVDDVERVC